MTMKKISFALLLISSYASAQPGYTKISARYSWLAVKADSGMHVPGYNGVPSDRVGVWVGDGAIACDTLNGHFYYRNGGTWIRVAKFSDLPATRFGVSGEDATAGQNRTFQQAGFNFRIENAANNQYFLLQPSAGRIEFYAESVDGFKSVAIDGTPDDIFLQAIDSSRNYLVGVGVGGTVDGTGTLLQASNSQVGISFINIKADSIVYKPHLGKMNIDTLRNWLATDVSDTTYKKPMTYDTRNGRWEYGNWHGGSGGATPTLQQVLDAGSTLTSSENIATGANTLTVSTGTTLVVPLNVTSTDVPSAVFLNNSITQAGLRISKQTSATTQKAVGLNILHTTSGTPDVGFGSSIEFESETVSGQNVQGYFNFNWADPITASRTSHADILGIDNAVTETFMNIQPSGVVRVNNLADTLATKAYARSVGGGGGGDVFKVGTPANNQLGVWTGDGTIEGPTTLTYDGTQLYNSATQTTNSGLRINNIEVQGFAVNNAWFGDNIFYDGNFKYRDNGYATQFYFYTGEAQFRLSGSGSAGSIVAQVIPIKINANQTVGIGGDMSATAATFTGAALLASSTGVIINEDGADKDTRIEGDTDPNLIVADAGIDKVGIKTASPHSSLHVNGSFAKYYLATESGITLDASHSIVEVTATGQTITLPTAVGIEGRIYTIILSASGSATVATTSSQNINGATTYSLASQYKYVTVVSNGTQWYVIANN